MFDFVIFTECRRQRADYNEKLTQQQQAEGDQQAEEGEEKGIFGEQEEHRLGRVAHSHRHIRFNHSVHLFESASKRFELYDF